MMAYDVPGGRPAMFEDAALPHQIILRAMDGGRQIAVSCTCLLPGPPGRRRRGKGDPVIGARARWLPGEAVAAWAAWHAAQGTAAAS
jgi:hypothetical protein